MTNHDLTAIARATGVLDDPDAEEEKTDPSELFWAAVTFCSAIFCLIAAGIAPQGAPL
ncbi:hypothetical protein [Corynebacterium sp. p3-SID1194]|uniref:hypothetical protein n=1 Tax=Corynebacterium sp. p3-SID1194 TaxID=2916105 RepID=UPI0021A2992F|nr:hypothetical protein [Corynebacterium sp. p3-SID1194]MCT1450620.1 hypothetical protein [Corynebacterium sp. p3-SID1194]